MSGAFALLPVAATALASLFDLRGRQIPNVFPGVLLFTAFALILTSSSQLPWASHVAALVIALVIGLLFAWSGGFGGGDVKLYAAVAAWFGLPGLLPLMLWIALAGLPLALVALARGQRDFAYGPAIFLGTLVHTAAPNLLADLIQ